MASASSTPPAPPPTTTTRVCFFVVNTRSKSASQRAEPEDRLHWGSEVAGTATWLAAGVIPISMDTAS